MVRLVPLPLLSCWGQKRWLPSLGTAATRSCMNRNACMLCTCCFGVRGLEHGSIQRVPGKKMTTPTVWKEQKPRPLQLQGRMAEVGSTVGYFPPKASENKLKEVITCTE